MTNLVDLHVHSTFSDGVRTPTELVEMACSLGLKALALADHDAVEGIDEALAAGAACNLEVLPAIEFSIAHGSHRDVHLLGYLLDHRSPELLEKLTVFRQRRATRGEAIVERINDKLKDEGKAPISSDEAKALAGGALGRPHIAQVLMAKKYVSDMQDAFVRYLVPCDVPKLYFPVEEALAIIRKLGGVAVLAHPVSITNERSALTEILDALCAMGLDGVEAFNNICSENDSAYLRGYAEKRGLIWTGGSDYHGIEAGISMGSGRGSMAIPYHCVQELKRVRDSR